MMYMVTLTATELSRRRFIAGAVIATAVLIGVTGWGFSYLPHIRIHDVPVTHERVLEMTAVLVILIAYLFSFLLAMAAVFIAAPSFANDIESGVLLPVLVRPLSRAVILLGRAAALAGIIAIYAILTGGLEFAVVHWATGYGPPHPAEALAYLALSGIVMVSLAAGLSTRMSALGASIVAIVAFIIARLGGIAQSLGTYYDNDTVRHAGTITQLALPSDAMWQAALYRLEPATMIAAFSGNHVWPGPFFIVSPPPIAVTVWTLLWIAAAGAIAVRSFALRDL